jgi:hypothetical protein
MEYRPGFSSCRDCLVDLVEELSEDGPELDARAAGGESSSGSSSSPKEADLEIILESIDPFAVSLAQKLLKEQGIPYMIRRGGGDEDAFSAVLGHITTDGGVALQILVPKQHVAAAEDLLADLLEDENPGDQPQFDTLPPELAGGDEPLPGELEDERLLREYEAESDEEDSGEEDGAEREPSVFCPFCRAEVVPRDEEWDGHKVSCPSCHRDFPLEDEEHSSDD